MQKREELLQNNEEKEREPEEKMTLKTRLQLRKGGNTASNLKEDGQKDNYRSKMERAREMLEDQQKFIKEPLNQFSIENRVFWMPNLLESSFNRKITFCMGPTKMSQALSSLPDPNVEEENKNDIQFENSKTKDAEDLFKEIKYTLDIKSLLECVEKTPHRTRTRCMNPVMVSHQSDSQWTGFKS